MDAPDNSHVSIGEEARQAQTQQVGELLRAARLERGLNIQDVARQLRFSVRQVIALEEDEYDKLVGGTFLRGFVRNYAKLLQLDAAPLLQLLEQSVPPPPAQIVPSPIEGIPFPSNRNHAKRNLIIGIGAVLALVLLVYEIYRGNEATVAKQPSVAIESKNDTEQATASPQASVPRAVAPQAEAPNADSIREQDERNAVALGGKGAAESNAAPAQQPLALAPSSPPAQQPPFAAVTPEPDNSGSPALSSAESANMASTPRPSYGGVGIHLMFDGESWAEVKDGRGKLLLSRINPPGSEQVLRGAPPYSLTIGNAAEVKLVYNNKPVDLGPYINPYGGTARLSLE